MVLLRRSLFQRIPLDHFKALLRFCAKRMPGNMLQFAPSRYALIKEIAKLDIADCGQDDAGFPFLKLVDGPIFYSHPPDDLDLRLHGALPRQLALRLPQECIRVASDIVCRWTYPHALPALTPPYPNHQRIAFHPQHRDTIDDLLDCTRDHKATLKRLFTVGSGDIVLDIGGYLGMGAMRLSEIVGDDGQVVSFEAHPVSSQIFLKNLEANGISNVSLMQMGVWNTTGTTTLNCERPQNNSLVAGHFDTTSTVEVRTNSVDNVVSELGLSKVSLVSLTINSAELEAIQGMQNTLAKFKPKLSIAGWYKRNGVPVHRQITQLLEDFGYRTLVGPMGRVYGWHPAEITDNSIGKFTQSAGVG